MKNQPENLDTKPAPAPKKFVTFSQHDSRAVETAYQKLADEYDDPSRDVRPRGDSDSGPMSPAAPGRRPNTSMNEAGQDEGGGGRVRVPVHEDFLFDVDIEQRELSPVYWLGPIYEVRRGSWFYSEGSTLRPCDENLAAQLEEGYLKIKPFRYPKKETLARSATLKAGDGVGSLALSGAFGRSHAGSNDVTPRASSENLRGAAIADENASGRQSPTPSPHTPQTYRLFGTYMNSVVTYQDATKAWLSANDILSRVSSTMYQKFAGGGYLGGVKLVRGYTDPAKVKEAEKTPSTPTSAAARSGNMSDSLQLDERQQKLLKRRSAPPIITSPKKPEEQMVEDTARSAMNSLTGGIDSEAEAEAVRKRDEKEIQNDYNDRDGENQGREIEHLILVTHGIGQRLGMR